MPNISTEYTHCNKCGTLTHLQVRGTTSLSILEDIPNESDPNVINFGIQALECPVCNTINLSLYIEDADIDEVIYPPKQSKPLLGLPPAVEREYKLAQKVRAFDPNSYGGALGRVLSQVCIDKGIKDKTLFEGINELASIGVIPNQIADMANQLRKLRNIAVHPELGELTTQEVSILDNLCEAILEYVYHAPELIKKAAQRIAELKK